MEEKGTIPHLPIAPDDPIPNVCSIKIANFPEVDLTDDEVAERFWERVAEQIEIQEDWNEMWHYRPYRGLRDQDPDLSGYEPRSQTRNASPPLALSGTSTPTPLVGCSTMA